MTVTHATNSSAYGQHRLHTVSAAPVHPARSDLPARITRSRVPAFPRPCQAVAPRHLAVVPRHDPADVPYDFRASPPERKG